MSISPKAGEVWFADLGYDAKPRYYFVVSTPAGGRLDIFSGVQLTTQFGGTEFEITLPRVPWLPEQSYCNAQTVQPLLRRDFVRRAAGQFDGRIFEDLRKALRLWLKL